MGPGEFLTLVISIWLLPLTKGGPIRRTREVEADLPQCLSYILNSKLHVDCSDRELTELPEDLNYEAQVLIISNNNFISFPPQLERFTGLETLDLSANHLSSPLPSYFGNMNSLNTLNLSNNNYGVWVDTGRTFSITRLDLSRNKINNIDEAAFSRMPQLRFLGLTENRINDLPSQIFANTHSLEIIHLCRNYFATLPSFQTNSLKTLHLNSCQISNLEKDALAGMSSLVELHLSMNQIESIPDNFASNTLQELDLSYNDISSITDDTFVSLPHLAVLNLRGNDFKEVWSTSHFSSNPFLREIQVKGNRWSCEGFHLNLLLTYEFLTRDPPKIKDRASLICYSPANVTQMSWQQAYIRTWHPNEVSTVSYTSFAVFIGIIIGVVVTSCICRGLMAASGSRTPRQTAQTTVVNLNGTAQPAEDAVVRRVPLREEDLPPSYEDALLMPRLRSSFHSLPDFVEEEEEEERTRMFRRSRSIGDLTESRPRTHDRRSTRRTLQIHANANLEL
ncbi:leucine-rich repeat-containing G-protein coupled receptor 5-like [Ostrinia nubilalis]|uniref:leucine-rich repeat-containing G-protein coupled receptor 5-like n=1 Tax=Ostrinia nubilalis TaxID=29057 RepID=UPI0030824FEA